MNFKRTGIFTKGQTTRLLDQFPQNAFAFVYDRRHLMGKLIN